MLQRQGIKRANQNKLFIFFLFAVYVISSSSSGIRAYSCEILSVQLCRTIGAGLLHCWCQGAALFLALLFDVFKAMPNYQYIYAELSV